MFVLIKNVLGNKFFLETEINDVPMSQLKKKLATTISTTSSVRYGKWLIPLGSKLEKS